MRTSAFIGIIALCPVIAIGSGNQQVTLSVTKMDCAVCPITVRKALEKVNGVVKAKVDYQTKQAVVEYDPKRASVEDFIRATTHVGFPSSPANK